METKLKQTAEGKGDPEERTFALTILPDAADTESVAEAEGLEDNEEVDEANYSLDPFSQVKGSYSNLASLLRPSVPLAVNIDASEPESTKQKTTILYILKEWFSSARPFIEARRVSIRRDGSFGADTRLRVEQLCDSIPAKHITEQDLQIGKLWSAISAYSSREGHAQHSIDTEPQLFSILLSRILETGRCHFQSKESPVLKLGRPLDGKLVWQELEHHQRLAIVALEDKSQHVSLRWRYPWYISRDNFSCGPVVINLSPAQVEAVFTASPVSKMEAPALKLFFSEIGLDRLIPPPKTKQKAEVRYISPQYSLNIESKECLATACIGAEKLSTPGELLKVITVTTFLPELVTQPTVNEDGIVIVEKYDPRPMQLAPLFDKMGFHELAASAFGASPQKVRYFHPERAESWIGFAYAYLPQLRAQGWDIPDSVNGQFEFVEFDSKDLIVGVEYEDNWWFSLSLTLEVDGQQFKLFPILVSAIRALPYARTMDSRMVDELNRNGRFVSMLPNGKIFTIPFERIRSILISVAEMISREPNAKNLRVSLMDVDKLLESEILTNARWLGAQRMHSLIEALRQLSSVPRCKPPRKFGTTLRPYQLDGLSWLQIHARHGFGGILADDMGLGKTVQVLAHICLEKQNKKLETPFLVICPTSVLPNWLSETEKFCPHLKVAAFSGPQRLSNLTDANQFDLIIAPYSLVIRELERLRNIHWHGIALDESQAIKNDTSQISQVVGSIPANHRFCMTGTPIENHLGELWSQFRFLLPGLLGDRSSFKTIFRKPIEAFGDIEVTEMLTRRIRPFVMRRTKNDVASELPAKTTIIQAVQLLGPQRDLYETVRLASTKKVRDEISKKGFHQSQIMILDALLKLRQACCDPRLVKLSAAKKVASSTKLEVLIEKLAELVAEGRKTLVFSQFTSMLDLIALELEKNGTEFVQLRGDTDDRVTPVERFQTGNVPVFLISLKAGGTGLNLTAADTVIHYDPWWNPAVEEQATDRTHRIGQTKNVFVYKLIAEGTIEQRMLQLQERKRNLASAILDGTGSPQMRFSEDEVEFLLSPIDSV